MRRPLFRQLWTLKLPRVAEISGVWNDQFFTNCNNVYPPNFFSCWIVYEKVLPSLFWTFQISNLSWNLPYSYFAFDAAFLSDFSSFRCLLFSFSRIVFSIPLLFERERFRSRLKTKFILDSVSESPPWIGLGWLSRLKILFTYDSFKNCRPCCPNPPSPTHSFPKEKRPLRFPICTSQLLILFNPKR